MFKLCYLYSNINYLEMFLKRKIQESGILSVIMSLTKQPCCWVSQGNSTEEVSLSKTFSSTYLEINSLRSQKLCLVFVLLSKLLIVLSTISISFFQTTWFSEIRKRSFAKLSGFPNVSCYVLSVIFLDFWENVGWKNILGKICKTT